MTSLPRKVGILGEGVTEKAVREKLISLDEFTLTSAEDADLVIASPGIPPSQYPSISAPIISDIEFAFRLFRRPQSLYCPKLIGVTGTNGKTTVTTLLSQILKAPAAGNIGTPLIRLVDDTSQPTWIVVELSSYQLERCQTFRPEISMLLNITEDHLSWHEGFENYAMAKANIFKHQTSSDTLIYTSDCEILAELIQQAPCKKIKVDASTPYPVAHNPLLKGAHNQMNQTMAYLAAKQVGLQEETILSEIRLFKPLPHRLEYITSIEGREFYNDSKSTNLDSTTKAVLSFDRPIHLILCGADKGLQVDTWLQSIKDKVRSIIVFGDISERIFRTAKKIDSLYPISKTHSLDSALELSYLVSLQNEVILFSPSSSSFDSYKNYEARGDAFKEAVLNLKDAISQ